MGKYLAFANVAFFGLLSHNTAFADKNVIMPPISKRVPKMLNIHGYRIQDDFAWLRDRNDKKDPAIIDYLTSENEYTHQVMRPHTAFINSLYKEVLGRIKQTDQSVPYKYGSHWYFTKVLEGQQYPVFLRSLFKDGNDPQILLDQNKMATGHDYFSISEFSPSDDGRFLAFATDTTGYRQYTLQIKDLKTNQLLDDKIERVTSVAWSSDSKYLFVSQEDPVSKRSDKVFRHTIGDSKDEVVYIEKDVLFNTGVLRSRDRAMLFIESSAATMDEYRYLSANDPLGTWKLLTAKKEGHEYAADFDNGEFYIRTNKDATNFKVVKAPLDDPREVNWLDFIPSNPKVKVEGIDFFKDYIVVSELENGLEYLRVMDRNAKKPSERISTPESVYALSLGRNPEYDTPGVHYQYSSMITPDSTFAFHFSDRTSELLKQKEIPSGYDKSLYETERVWATARDGVKVPISIVSKKGIKRDGSAALLLYAYGSYGFSIAPTFSTNRISLLDRGMTYAIAHVRGGSELGEEWRQDGRMFKKLNTFYDFIDSAKWLIEQKYTSANRLVIQGGSAGGLLMGGAVNMSPNTFRAALIQVPFVDVMNTMLDESLPLTTEEWIEWGNPNEKKAWDYMIQYSPYDNIKAQDYPNMLIEISLNDSQVPYWEGAKFAAKIRANKTDSNVVLLKTNMGAGHGGASGRYDRLKEIAFEYAYALTQVGITK